MRAGTRLTYVDALTGEWLEFAAGGCPPPSELSDAPGLPRLAIRMGMPVSFRLELTTTGNKAVTLFDYADPAAGYTSLYLTPAGGVPERITTDMWE